MVIRSEAKANTLEQIYDVCNRLFKGKNCFFTKEELEQKKADENNIFLTRRKGNVEVHNNRFCDMVCDGVASTIYQSVDIRNSFQAGAEACHCG